MAEYDYDLFTIGAGSGGVRASRMAAQYGARVGVAEEYRVGGTCVIRGCVPKKLLVYASHFAEEFHDAKGFGWEVGTPKFNWRKLIENKDNEIDRLNGVYIRNLKNSGVDIFQTRATLKDPHTVYLADEDRTVTAAHILVATGGAPLVDTRIAGHEYGITSNEAFHLEELPEHIVIAGGGYIAVEFAGIFNGLGVETCLLYRGEDILRHFDPDISTHVHNEMKKKGIRIITQSVFEKIEKRGERDLVCHLTNGVKIDCDTVMWAIGRNPNTAGLGLEEAGVKLDAGGAVIVDEFSKTSVDHIYAVGDVTNRMNLTPVAIREGAAFAETVFNGNPSRMDYRDIPKAVFSQPPVGTVGMTEPEARKEYGRIDVYKTSFRSMKYTLSDNEERMLMKLVVAADTGKVVGCHLVGPDAPEMIQCVAIAVKAGLTKAQFDETVALHPTSAEELVTMRDKVAPLETR